MKTYGIPAIMGKVCGRASGVKKDGTLCLRKAQKRREKKTTNEPKGKRGKTNKTEWHNLSGP